MASTPQPASGLRRLIGAARLIDAAPWVVHGLAVIALLCVLAVAGSDLEPIEGMQRQLRDSAAYYDLSISYLVAWFLHLLVIVLPNHARRRAILQSLREPLEILATNGAGLVRDLEYVGRCPSRPITEEHVFKVCHANNYNDALLEQVYARLTEAHRAYETVAPYLTELPHDLVGALQTSHQSFIHQQFWHRASTGGRQDRSLYEMRTPSPVYGHPGGPRRNTFKSWAGMVYDYFVATERVRTIVGRLYGGATLPDERVNFFLFHYGTEPPRDSKASYPAEATSDDWAGG